MISGQQDLSVHTQRHTLILLLYYKDIFYVQKDDNDKKNYNNDDERERMLSALKTGKNSFSIMAKDLCVSKQIRKINFFHFLLMIIEMLSFKKNIRSSNTGFVIDVTTYLKP